MEVTAKAAAELKTIMEKQKKETCGLRIFVAGLGCSGPSYGLAFEEKPDKSDSILESNGIKLYIEKMVAEILEGAKLDYITTPNGSGFIITNPNAQSACSSGCDHCH